MKIILSIALLVTGVAGNTFVFGQTLPSPHLEPVLRFPKIQLSPFIQHGLKEGQDLTKLEGKQPALLPDQGLIVLGGKKPEVLYSWVWIKGDDSIRILRPDHMPCLVSNLSQVERMPVGKVKNSERMPTRVPK